MTSSQKVKNASRIVVGIDATNLRAGGGRTHLIEMLRAVNPESSGVGKVIVWGSRATLALLDNRPWLHKISPAALDGNLLTRTLWQRFRLSPEARAADCDVLFVPGGSYAGDFSPVISMSRNMLPFEWRELLRYGCSVMTLKLLLVRLSQQRTFRSVDGLIFLTRYASHVVGKVVQLLPPAIDIPHGVSERFFQPPRDPVLIGNCTSEHPFRILYVSIVDVYKHQWHVVAAIAQLRKRTGWPLTLELVGPAYPPAARRLQAAIDKYDPDHSWVRYNGPASFDDLHTIYKKAHVGLFASSCENMPNILLETMASGLPVASSNRGPMPEILHDSGVYFDPECPEEIASTLHKLIVDPSLRLRLANSSFAAAHQYTWARCADETFRFIYSTWIRHAEVKR